MWVCFKCVSMFALQANMNVCLFWISMWRAGDHTNKLRFWSLAFWIEAFLKVNGCVRHTLPGRDYC